MTHHRVIAGTGLWARFAVKLQTRMDESLRRCRGGSDIGQTMVVLVGVGSRLLLLSFLAGAIAFVASLYGYLANMSALSRVALRRWELATSGALWGALVWATVGALALCGVLTGLERLAGRLQRPRMRDEVSRASSPSLAQVRARVLAAVQQREPDVVLALDEMIRGALALRASDLHLTPTSRGLRVTYRRGGQLEELGVVDAGLGPRLSARVKVLSRLDTFVTHKPHDGKLRRMLDGSIVRARASTLPTELGERVVLRFVSETMAVPPLGELELPQVVTRELEQMLERPEGMLLVTGPVGSGKTTTLYSALQAIAQRRIETANIMTLEDPIELELGFAAQTQVSPRTGLTFAATLRSVLRQDPNVLMIGEIRDRETASIAVQAGLTGHLVLTTIHGRSAAGALTRLQDMGIEQYLLSSVVLGALSQRLVRLLCMDCRRASPPATELVAGWAGEGTDLPTATYYEPVGCPSCEGRGYVGRAPLAELLVVDDEIREALKREAPLNELERLSRRHGSRGLLESGLELAARGETSLSELARVCG